MSDLTNHKLYDITREINVENPTIEKDRRTGSYKWGKDNLFPQYLASLKYNCAIHGGIINSKVHYTIGGGLAYDGLSKELFDKFIKNGNSDYDLNEVTQFLSSDLETFGAYAFLITYVNGRSYKITPIDFEKLRKSIDEDYWLYSEDWTDKSETVISYKTLDLTDRTGVQIVVYMEPQKQIKIGKKIIKSVYPLPSYFGGILAIETDIAINTYRRYEIENGFSLGTIINFNSGQPQTKEDKDKTVSMVADTTQGVANAGGVMVVFNEDKNNETTVTNINGNNLDQRYTVLSEDNKENILQAHSVTSPMLFGIKTEGQLGGATELEVSYNLMKEGYFQYKQKAILSTLNYIFNEVNGGDGKLNFVEVSITGADVEKEGGEILTTLNTMSPLLANSVLRTLTTNEVRSLAGLEPVEGGDALPNQNEATQSFTKEADVINHFRMFGRDKKGIKFIASRPVNKLDLDEENFIKSFKKFATEKQINILALINENIPFEQIAKTLKISNSELSREWSRLESEGLLDGNEITTDGARELASNERVTVEVVYSYEVRPELGQPEIIPTTRDFCRDLIELNRVYTRFEIEQISNIVGRDVWTYRGGWYHNPQTDKTTASCRHYWSQNLVIT